MPSQIRPNRLEVSDRFPMLGFSIRTDGGRRNCEVTLAADPSLFQPDAKSRRTPGNFYSSRVAGPMWITRGEGIFVLAPEVLARFVGNDRIYFALATYPDSNGSAPELASVPSASSPYVSLRSFTGRTLRRVRMLPSRQRAAYGNGNGAELEWAGDSALPGMQQLDGGTKAANGATPAPTTNGNGAAAPVQASGLAYDDGYGPLPVPTPDAAAEDDARGIDGPIPDEGAAAQALDAPAAATPEYPDATRFVPAARGNYRARSGPREIRQIVIHITDGRESIEGPISWFRNPAAQASAHYIVGRDGEVVQMVRHDDVAWHAHHANGASIGIEHVANTKRLFPTEDQYAASAALVAWLCDQYALPIDREHILGHAEADTTTTHRGCPTGAHWDWSYYMQAVSDAASPPPTESAQALSSRRTLPAGRPQPGVRRVESRLMRATPARASRALAEQSFTFNWDDVELVPQRTGMSCWAAAAAMVVGWRDRVSITDDFIAEISGRVDDLETGLPANQGAPFADALGLVYEAPSSYSVDGLRELLERNGPLWVGIAPGGTGGHAIVVVGMRSDGSPDGTDTFVRIADPWDRVVNIDPATSLPGAPVPGAFVDTHVTGSRYILTWADFLFEYETRASSASDGSVNIQIMHAGGTGGRSANYGAPASYAQAAGTNGRKRARTMAPPPPRRLVRARAMDAGRAPVASVIAGAAMERVVDGRGAVTWELEQLAGLKHPNDQPPAVSPALGSGPTIHLADWPYLEVQPGVRVSAAFTVGWQQDGRSLGNVVIANTEATDAPGCALRVLATILDDAALYPETSPTYAALLVRVEYIFTREGHPDTSAVTTLHLFADGTYDQTSRWQEALPA